MNRTQVIEQLPALRRYARVLTGDAWAADDLVQDTLERACSKWLLWRRGSDLRAWLFTIMHNLHANDRRRTASRPRAASIDDVLEPGRPASQIESLAAREMLAALRLLSLEHRQVLLKTYFQGQSASEAAQALGLPVPVVKRRIYEAMQQLRRMLPQERLPIGTGVSRGRLAA